MSVNQLENVIPGVPLEPTPPPSTEPAGDEGYDIPDLPVFKKYGGDPEKINEGYFNAVNELSRKNEVLNSAAVRIQQLENAVQQLLGGGQPAAPVDPLTELSNDLGLTSAEPVKKGIRHEVMEALNELLGPIARQMQADETLESEIENFGQLKVEARRFMGENKEVAETFKAVRDTNPAAAWKYAIREMVFAKGGRVAPRPAGASLPGAAATGGFRASEPMPIDHAKQESEALEYGRNYGDMSSYRAARLKNTSVTRAVQRALRQAGLVPDEGW